MHRNGFTLIEVLVSLSIFAVMAAAIVLQSGGYGEQVFRLERTTIAYWVAENRINTLRSTREWPASGRQESETDFGGRSWLIEQTVESTAREGLRRVEVAISEEGDEDNVIVTLVGFLGEH